LCKPGGLARPQRLTKPRFPKKFDDAMAGKIVAFPEVGGLHYRYERRAA
jgi:hypothetical protein